MTSPVLIVGNEHHYLPTCPCPACVAERGNRVPPQTPLKRLSVNAAYILGFIKHRSPHGSLARQIAKKQ